jgi:hypothetical protein
MSAAAASAITTAPKICAVASRLPCLTVAPAMMAGSAEAIDGSVVGPHERAGTLSTAHLDGDKNAPRAAREIAATLLS